VFDDADLSASGPVVADAAVADAAVAGAAPVDGVGEVAGLVEVLAVTAGRLAELDVAGVASDDLQRLVVGVERCRRRIDAGVLHAAGELDVRGSTDIEHGLATGKWLAREALLPAKAANRTVRHGRRLRSFPKVDEALTAGRYGVDHAAVLLGVAHNATRTRSGSGPYTDPTLTLTGTINPDSTLHLDHRATTRTGWTLTIDAAQRLEWTTPTGTTIHGQQHGTRTSDRAGPAPPTAAA
jgi:hypothetical protein